jgi:hypothetical protein
MLRVALLAVVLLLPGLAAADDDVPPPGGDDEAPAGDGSEPGGEEDVPSPRREPPPPRQAPDGAVPSPEGAPLPAADGSVPPPAAPVEAMPTAEGGVPGPDGEPFPGAPGDAPAPAALEADASAEEPAAEAPSPLARPTDVLYEEGQVLFARLEFDAAAGRFEEVLRRENDHEGARNYLVESLRALGRQEDADAVLAGANPPGDPTPVPEEERAACSRNPRADRRFSAGLGIGGPDVGFGVWAEYRPHWLVGIGAAVGGLVLVEGDRATGVGSVALGADLLPIPFVVTPVVGVGLAAVFGDALWRVDAMTKPLATGTDFRLLPYLSLGARADLGRLQLQGGVWLVPTGDRTRPFLPVPGARVGVLF